MNIIKFFVVRTVAVFILVIPVVFIAHPLHVHAQKETEANNISKAALSKKTIQLVDISEALANASEDAKTALVEQALQVAQERKNLIQELLEVSPSLVLSGTVPETVRASLPPEISALIEEAKTLRGTFAHEIWDNFESEVTGNDYFITENINDKKYRVFIDGLQKAQTGDQVIASGFVLDNLFFGGTITPESSEFETESLPTTVKKVAVILFNFQNDTRTPYTVDQARSTTFTSSTGVNAYYQENSFGQWSLEGKVRQDGDVYGWYTIPLDNTNCGDYRAWSDAARLMAENSGVDLTGYDNIIHAFPYQSHCGWGGRGTLGGQNSWINSNTYARGTVAHELGHNVTLHHANTLICTDGSGTRVPMSDTCYDDEYGDMFDIMGQSSPFKHFNAYHKKQGNPSAPSWFAPENVLVLDPVANPDGVYTIDPIEYQSSSTQVIRVRRDFTYRNGSPEGFNVTVNGDYYHLEYRRPYGFDNFSSTDPVVNGISIRLGGWKSFLIDTVPSTTSFTDAPLTLGKTFTDSQIGFNVVPISVSPTGVQVRITFGELPCTNIDPTLTLSPSNQSVFLGQSAIYNYTLTNNDTASCPASTFSVSSPDLPVGWTQVPDSAEHTLTPGSSTGGTIEIFPAQSATPGTYNVREVAVDNLVPSHQNEATATLTLLQPDTTPPAVSITTPADGAVLPSNGNVWINTTASDASGISSMRIFINGSLVQTCSGSTACDYRWAMKGVANGVYTILAEATDSSPNANVGSKSIVVSKGGIACTPANPSVSITPATQSGTPGTALSYSVTVTNNDSSSCAASSFDVTPTLPGGWTQNPASFSATISPGNNSSASVSITSSTNTPNGTYTFTQTAVNNASLSHTGSATADYVVNSTPPPQDTTPPAVSITTPADGAVLPSNGNVWINTTASDASGISSMRIFINGSLVQTCSGSTACDYRWAMKGVANGVYTILAEATDSSPNANVGSKSVVVSR